MILTRKTVTKGIMFLLIVLQFPLESVQAQTPSELRGNQRYRRRGLMNGNLVHTLFWNYGEVGDYPQDPSGSWPTPDRHYLDDITLIVSVEVANRDGELIHPMSTQYREFVDRSPENVPWGFEPRPFWFNMDEGENKFPAMSNNPTTWPVSWLDKPSSWNGFWHGYFGKGITNAQLETFFVFGDSPDKEPNLEMNYYADDNDETRGGLGIWVSTRGFQWSQVLAEDCVFWLYNIHSEASHDYRKAYFTQYIDWGIGGVGTNLPQIGEYDADLDIAFAYTPSGAIGVGGWSPIGYAGYAFLESPGIFSDLIDNDHDGLVDESRESDGPGEYLSVAPYGFDDPIAFNNFVEFYNREPGPHWSNDENGDWVPYTDLNGNGEWDPAEPLNDDVGADGVNPFEIHYTGPDEGEGDGMPTNGEPNYNATDPDESDQIGLTGFEIFPVHQFELWNDEENWGVFSRSLPPVDEIVQPSNLGMFFSSGSFPMVSGQTERYSMALLFGQDRDDLTKNKKTVQQIYNADYRFSRPPLKPTLTVYPGDGEVTLVWDDIAEKSYDPFLQEFDFEGYMIYRSTEPQFLENKTITDSYGNSTYRKPLAQFDKINGKKGPHPVDLFGVKFNLGDVSGLKHSFTDRDVKNGQTYFYAVVSYDYGLFHYDETGVEGIQPSESPAIISVNSLGEVVFTDINTGVATPRPAAAGYIPAQMDGDIEQEGPGTGYMTLDIVEKHKVPSGSTVYEIEFKESSKYHTTARPYYSITNVTSNTLIADSIRITTYGDESPNFDGMIVSMYNDTIVTIDSDKSEVVEGSTDYITRIRINPNNEDVAGYRLNLERPADYRISFHETADVLSAKALGYRSVPAPFDIYNITDSLETLFTIADIDRDGAYSHGDDIIILIPDSDFPLKYYTSWMIRFDAVYELDTISTNGTIELDTTWITNDPPDNGDVIYIATKKPFRNGERFRFIVNGADSSNTLAKAELDDIYVVPDPYVVTASWEPTNSFRFGRGERRIQFFNLPKDCTIRIYNLRGHLIDVFEHHSNMDDGMESWDMLSKDGNEISFGIYVFHVDAPDVGQKIGRFAVIK